MFYKIMEKKFKIRDLRKKDQYKIDDAYLNGYARLCGIYATAVYNSLSRHANFYTQESFPSIEKISEQHNISKPSVIKGIKELEKWGIVKIIKEKDEKTKRQLTNVYILADKTEWIEKPTRVNDIDSEKPSKPQIKSRVNHIDCKDTKVKDNKVFSNGAAVAGKYINDLIKLFELVNPTYERLYEKKSERQSLERLIKKFGGEKVKNMIEILPSIINKPYAPKIITPFQLEKDLGKLIAFYNQEKSRKNLGVVET